MRVHVQIALNVTQLNQPRQPSLVRPVEFLPSFSDLRSKAWKAQGGIDIFFPRSSDVGFDIAFEAKYTVLIYLQTALPGTSAQFHIVIRRSGKVLQRGAK